MSDDSRRLIRMSLLMQSLDRQTREHLSALIVDMVRQRKTDSEFRAIIEMLELMESSLIGTLKGQMDTLLDSVDFDGLNEKAEEILERSKRDDA